MDGEVVAVIFQAACNRVAQPCGCANWDELESGRWVRKSWVCVFHETVAAREEAR